METKISRISHIPHSPGVGKIFEGAAGTVASFNAPEADPNSRVNSVLLARKSGSNMSDTYQEPPKCQALDLYHL